MRCPVFHWNSPFWCPVLFFYDHFRVTKGHLVLRHAHSWKCPAIFGVACSKDYNIQSLWTLSWWHAKFHTTIAGQHDIMSDVGYSNTLFLCLNLRPGTGCWLAPVCSTWVFMTLCLRSCLNLLFFTQDFYVGIIANFLSDLVKSVRNSALEVPWQHRKITSKTTWLAGSALCSSC